jgi:tRNA A37 threonylcarbamoyladenosine dehydratase
MRKRLKNIGLSLDIPCVYSNEKPLEPIDKSILGSTAFVPSAAGLTMASYVIQELIKGDE